MPSIYAIGNSHIWTLCGWDRFAGKYESTGGLNVIRTSHGGLDISAVAFTHATAHNIDDDQRSHGSEHLAFEFLDSELQSEKDVLCVFGDIDVRHIVERHPGEVLARLDTAINCYADFLSLINSRPDVNRLLVGSVTGHHSVLPMTEVEWWNSRLHEVCRHRMWTYVDLTSLGHGDHAVCSVNHLPPHLQDPMVAAVLQALGPLADG